MNGFLTNVFFLNGFNIEFYLYTCVLLGILGYATWTDLKTMMVPDKVHILLMIVGLFIMFRQPELTLFESIKDSGLGLLIGGGFMLFLAIVSTMGGADIKLIGVLGLWLGMKGIISVILLSFSLGLFGALLYLIRHRKKDNKGKVKLPFVPYISVATLIIWFVPNFVF